MKECHVMLRFERGAHARKVEVRWQQAVTCPMEPCVRWHAWAQCACLSGRSTWFKPSTSPLLSLSTVLCSSIMPRCLMLMVLCMATHPTMEGRLLCFPSSVMESEYWESADGDCTSIYLKADGLMSGTSDETAQLLQACLCIKDQMCLRDLVPT